jgi:FtsP/CotA-like multicopper oxidase with cupredoxin domain
MKKKKFELKMTRRQVLKAGMIGGAGMVLPLRFLPAKAWADDPQSACAWLGGTAEGCTNFALADPQIQSPLFVEDVPNALNPAFLFKDMSQNGMASYKPNYSIRAAQTIQETGLIHRTSGKKLKTTVWGYGKETITWPGQTFQVMSSANGGPENIIVRWSNELQGKKHLLPVDTSLHWAYSLKGDSSANGVDYSQYSIKKNGVPIITHLHGGHTDFQFDGNPEYFYSPDGEVQGPQWDFVDGGFTTDFVYDNTVPAGTLWYHDHALGITRLNVYAGLAGFYFVRDDIDTGESDNPLGLPAYPYELAYAIQDRMFTDMGALFYPAFPGDPYYEGFINGEGANLPEEFFPGGGPTALAEFFGDHMVVNGKIWPKTDVEHSWYRLRLLNGCDSRFLVIQFIEVPGGATDFSDAIQTLDFKVIGSDQGLGTTTSPMNTLVFEPGARYDVLIDFDQATPGNRVIMKNIGGDEPFGGGFPNDPTFEFTDRVMAFDVKATDPPADAIITEPLSTPTYTPVSPTGETTRRVALFEGRDEFNRLQPLLGTVDDGPLTGNDVAHAYAWHQPTTEDPELGSTEVWEIYNFTADAHPIHLHLVNFTILDRESFEYEIDEDDQIVPQHNGTDGTAPKINNIHNFSAAGVGSEYYEDAPKDMVISLPGDPEPESGNPTGQMVRIRAHFDKPGRYVWHCHILSHEDHEMMRVLEVVEPV